MKNLGNTKNAIEDFDKEYWQDIERQEREEGIFSREELLGSITNFIWTCFHQFFDDFYSFNGDWKPLIILFNWYSLYLKVINIGQAIRQSGGNLYGIIATISKAAPIYAVLSGSKKALFIQLRRIVKRPQGNQYQWRYKVLNVCTWT